MSVSISMIFLDTPTANFTVQDVVDVLNQKWPELHIDEVEAQETTMSCNVDGTPVVLGHMPGPMPWNELKEIYDSSLLWPEGEEQLSAHPSHMIVTVSGDLAPVDEAVLLTKVTSAVMNATSNALGVYWANAQMVVRKDIFEDFVADILPEGPPVLLWVKIIMGPSPDGKGSAGFTTGMKALGHMDFETLNASDTLEELMDRFASMASYVLTSGAVINDGDTIGESARERIKVIYSDSTFGHEEQVMRLDYSSLATKPWWKFW